MQQIGKYQLIRKLAAGGMAEVFLAKAAGPMGFEKTLVLKPAGTRQARFGTGHLPSDCPVRPARRRCVRWAGLRS